MTNAGKRSQKYCPSTGSRVSTATQAADASEADGQRRRERRTRHDPLGDVRDDDDGERDRHEPESGLDGGVAEDVLHVERQEEELREGDGPDETAIVTFAAASVRSRKIPIGKSGAFERSSMTTKARSSATDPARSEIVVADAQPSDVARVIAYTSSMRPAVIEAAPATSKRRCGRSARLSRRRIGVSAIAAEADRAR